MGVHICGLQSDPQSSRGKVELPCIPSQLMVLGSINPDVMQMKKNQEKISSPASSVCFINKATNSLSGSSSLYPSLSLSVSFN